nr:helix-turn-helix domain-containing protein [uncultured Lachnoclostridium sp.]
MTIGERLKNWRKENKLTSSEVAAKAGISQGGLSEYENDKKLIGSKTLLSLNEAFNIDINYILTGEERLNLSEDERDLLMLFNTLPQKEQYKIMGILEDKVKELKQQSDTSIKIS